MKDLDPTTPSFPQHSQMPPHTQCVYTYVQHDHIEWKCMYVFNKQKEIY